MVFGKIPQHLRAQLRRHAHGDGMAQGQELLGQDTALGRTAEQQDLHVLFS